MRTFLRASMGAIAAAVLMMGCGEGPPVQPDYPGEPLVTLKGQLLVADHVQVDEPVRLALVWYKSSTDSSQPRDIVTEDIVYEPSFPIDFTFHLYAPPPPEALTEYEGGVRFGSALLVAYRDDNHNGKLDPIPPGGVPQDRVLGATGSAFGMEGPRYALGYWEDPGGLNGRFILTRVSGEVEPAPGENVPLDTPITLTLTGENELAALICMAPRTPPATLSPNPLEFCGLPATPGILRVLASFVLNIRETSTGEKVQALTNLRVSDGTRWLTDADATATLDGQPLHIGDPGPTPGVFPAPGAVSTLVISAPGFPTATFQVKAPGIPSLSSPASGATFPSGSSLRFAWSPGPFTASSDVSLMRADDFTALWNRFSSPGPWIEPPNPFDVTTSPIAYTGDAVALLVADNAGSSRYGSQTWQHIEYMRRVTFTP
jgi:hypothetical protein